MLLAGVLSAPAQAVQTACYAMPMDQSLVGTGTVAPTDAWAVVPLVRNTFALQILLKGPQGRVTWSPSQFKLVGTIRADMVGLAQRPQNVEEFVSVGQLHWTSHTLKISYNLSAKPSITVTPDQVNHTVTSQGATNGMHAVFRYPASSPFVVGSHSAKTALSMRASAVVGVADGVGNAVFGDVHDTAAIPGALGRGDIRERRYKPIDCQTGYDGLPAKHHRRPSPTGVTLPPSSQPSAGGGSATAPTSSPTAVGSG